MRFLSILICSLILTSCSGVGSTVLQDFGLQDRPDDYVSGSDKVMTNMRAVGATELKRLNAEHRHGEIKYDDSKSLLGRFYKEVRVYTKAYPLDAQPMGRQGSRKQRGFVGLIDYAYEIKESPRFANRTEAAAANTNIPGRKGGRERFRYQFTSSGNWNGAKGTLAK